MPVFPPEVGNNLDGPPEPLQPWESAPPQMVDYDECPSLKEGELKRLSRKAGVSRTEERDKKINELKLKYRNHWGTRSGAKYIAGSETDTGDPISERTVQEYFRITRT